jgi:hypothetical protein
MKSLLKIVISILLITSCTNSNTTPGSCDTVCEYTVASGETAGTMVSGSDGSYELTFDYAQPGSPFTNGTTAKFTLMNNVLTVEITGKDCITIKNPIKTSQTEYTFKDTCRDNLSYSVSATSGGDLNEINISSTSGTWFGQFTK